MLKEYLKMVWRVLKFLHRHRNAKLIWSAPSVAKVVIIESSHAEYLARLCGSDRIQIVELGGAYLHLSPKIVISAICQTLISKNPDVGYTIALLQQIRPLLTITWIDNSPVFYEVSRRFEQCRFLAIQNAARYDTLHLSDRVASQIHIPEFACFGKYEEDLYSKKGASVGKYYPIGGLTDSYYREQCSGHQKKKEYDICVVGEASPEWDQIEFPGMEDAIGNIAKYAERFCLKYKKRLWVAGKREASSPHHAAEILWYRKYLGVGTSVMPRVASEFTTHDVIDRSHLSIAFISTALQEGMSRGNRVLYCNFTGQERWDFPVEGLWLLKEASYEAFEKRVLELLNMTDSEFTQRSASTSQYVMNYSSKKPTHVFLQELISTILEKKIS